MTKVTLDDVLRKTAYYYVRIENVVKRCTLETVATWIVFLILSAILGRALYGLTYGIIQMIR